VSGGQVLLLCGCVTAFLLAQILPAGDSPSKLACPPGAAPVIDGVLAPGEWDDAARISGPQGWISQFSPVKDRQDLSFTIYTKHDKEQLFFAFDVTDDLLYGIDTPRWLPDNNPKAHDLTPDGWPWFGDEVELLIHAGPRWKGDEPAAGNGFAWQMVCNLTKSRLGGIGKGGLLEGEPRSDPNAFATYRRWIESGAMRAAAKPKPGRKGYIIEWSIRFNPCLEIEPGKFYSPALGDRPVGLNIAVGDLDEKETGAGNFGNFHHEDWFAGQKDVRTQLRYWGTLWILTSRSAPARR
jgi:solute:Na+ symporter, SSS family